MAAALEEDADVCLALGNYSSYSEFKAEADALLVKERAANWLDLELDLRTLERRHGLSSAAKLE